MLPTKGDFATPPLGFFLLVLVGRSMDRCMIGGRELQLGTGRAGWR
jgi:hypothetical protein